MDPQETPKPSTTLPKQYHFVKYESNGNDYLVADPAQNLPRWMRKALEKNPKETSARICIREICDRHRGIGADGILYGPLPLLKDDPSDAFRLRIFNPDSIEAEISGNGLRIFAAYLQDRGYQDECPGPVELRIGQRSMQATYLLRKPVGFPVGEFTRVLPGRSIKVLMGVPRFCADAVHWDTSPQDLAVTTIKAGGRSWQVHGVSMGNPHAVIFVEGDGNPLTLAREHGQAIESCSHFTQRTNVQFAKVNGLQDIHIGIWERGTGYTLSSGSSACAAAAAVVRYHGCKYPLAVHCEGGVVIVDQEAGKGLIQTASVSRVFTGFFNDDWSPPSFI